ncbi:HNH endonuclease signature motif containing protein [Streptomyces sp. H27-H1]|uniref:HNH endonuclease n=1 Tax=Streptomyces sp. H27-H1 TaxID=2996461 RepID=UPI00226F3D6D|nr:HNH endonuclease signature motif containing protein [Streptomyces sp. H27-H1]MCY0928318.1 HNH endonuclease signature motif containing protein [Streptomyces sp. H27-H1]
MVERICSEPECGKAHRAKGLCSTHYNQQKPERHKPQAAACSVCGTECSKGRSRERVVCSYACRWFLQNERYSSPVYFPTCDWCRAIFADGTGVERWCSDPCRSVATRETWPSWRVSFPICTVCGNLFATPYNRVTCSLKCEIIKLRDDKREAKYRYRARKRNAFVAPVLPRAIFERDRWRCHLCGRAIRRGAVVPAPLAPVLDHVIPLAQGGTHEPANVQAAHYLCNSIKSDGYVDGGEQLMLIG